MRPGLRPGAIAEHSAVVRAWMRPRLEGLVRHRLYSTWAMVYHAEVAARKLLAPYLEPGEEAVGAAVALRHLGPAAIGERLLVRARLSRVSGRRVHAAVDVFAGGRRVGAGSHLQVVIPKAKLGRLSRGGERA